MHNYMVIDLLARVVMPVIFIAVFFIALKSIGFAIIEIKVYTKSQIELQKKMLDQLIEVNSMQKKILSSSEKTYIVTQSIVSELERIDEEGKAIAKKVNFMEVLSKKKSNG